ncbi:MAG: NUDIX domain-containing protein [Bacilli bacterium]|nr:NUDIX domain-containing protein [Bacilli bacterium]
MNIEIYADGIGKEDANHNNFSEACRGLVKHNGKYLLVELKKWRIFTLPGGRREPGEALSTCVEREVLEETGIIVKAREHKVSITEYFIDSVWLIHYFVCDYVEDTNQVSLTEEEIDLELIKCWKTEEEVFDIFENTESLHEHGSTIHHREFIGFINSL